MNTLDMTRLSDTSMHVTTTHLDEKYPHIAKRMRVEAQNKMADECMMEAVTEDNYPGPLEEEFITNNRDFYIDIDAHHFKTIGQEKRREIMEAQISIVERRSRHGIGTTISELVNWINMSLHQAVRRLDAEAFEEYRQLLEADSGVYPHPMCKRR